MIRLLKNILLWITLLVTFVVACGIDSIVELPGDEIFLILGSWGILVILSFVWIKEKDLWF